jgi:AcrR family transcriptional regulator
MTVDVGDSTERSLGLLPPGVVLTPPKRRLYEAAMELFGRDGYHGVSIRDIANALGQQPSAIYFHVESKQELLYELALLGHETHLKGLRDALMDAGSEPLDQLTAVVTAHVEGHMTYPAMARLTNRELGALTEEQLRTVLAIRSQAEQIFIDVLDRGVRMDVFHVDDTFLAAKALGAMGVRIPEWWKADSPRTRDEIVTAYVEYARKLVA